MTARPLLAIPVAAAALLTGCGPDSEADNLRAAQAACPHGIERVDFAKDGTTQIESLVCKGRP